MRSKVKQMLSVILTVCMLATVVPLNAYADDVDFGDSETTDLTVDSSEENTDVDISEEEPEDETEISVEEDSQDEDTADADDTEEDVFSSDDDLTIFSDGDAEAVGVSLNDCYEYTYVAAPQLTDSFFKIVFVDCGRKYFSVSSLKKIIDNAAEAGFNYVELGVGNDGLRFLLDDMSLTVNDKTYDSDEVTSAIHEGNEAYYNFDTDELTEEEMNSIITYASSKGIGIIPMINTPGHMDAILSAANLLTGETCSYNGSARTIDVTNATAVAFTQALVQKYITYFKDKGCKLFNMGADEYANDKFASGSMGFGNLQSEGKYSYYVKYVNKMANMIKTAGMTPMAFNDGIYFDNDTSSGTFDTDIVVCYWSSGWTGYTPMSASDLQSKGFRLINTHGDYYWVLGKSDWQCDATKASGFDYKAFQGSTIENPLGAMFCIWCDYPGAGNEDTVISSTAATIAAFGETLPKSTETTATPTPTESTEATATPTPPANDVITETEKTINVAVDGSTTDEIKGYNYSEREFTTDNPSIATVKVTGGADAKEASTTYSESSVKYNTLISENYNSWQRCGNYYYKASDGKYYPLYAKRSSSRNRSTYTYTYTWGYLDLTGKYQTITTESNISYPAYYSPSITVYTPSTTEAVEAFTKLTFTGVSVGTTSVQIGGVKYTINVVEQAPDTAMTATSIDLEYWITNSKVYETNSTSGVQIKTITTDTDGITSDDGVAVANIAPKQAYSNFDDWMTVYYWQTMRLDSKNKQTSDSGDDETSNGTTLTHIRYYGGAWQYKTLTGTWNYFESSDQLVAYYLQKTDVTKEIETYSKDWGYGTNDTTQDTSSGNGQVALTVAVVYPDGTVSPAEDDMYANSTTIFNYWSGRDIGIVSPENNSNYSISKITVTDGKRDENTSANVWYTDDTITWKMKQISDESEAEWYDETTVWDDVTNAGTTPMVNGKTSEITWSDKNTAKLVLIYLKTVQKETNLKVKYVNDEDNTDIFDFEIAMSYNEGDPEPSFVNALNQTHAHNVGEITLDDDAYVTNISGVNQAINKDLVTVASQHPDKIDSKYLSGIYTYKKAYISEDGKTLTLHYNVDTTKVQTGYVVDFGEPITVRLSDVVDNAEKVTDVDIPEEAEKNTYVINKDDDGKPESITFKIDEVLTGSKLIKVVLKYEDASSLIRRVALVPATTVYYEASFVEGGSGATKMTETQETAKPHETQTDGKANYGYDDSYAGTAANDNQINLKDGAQKINFRGTGIDIYADTTTETGTMMIMVKEGNSYKKIVAVDTKMANGNTASTDHQTVGGTNVPVATLDLGSEPANYTAELSCVKSGSAGKKDVYLDGFRVYNTLSDDGGAYAADNEANPSYFELRDQVIAAVASDSTVDGGRYASQIAKNTMSQVYASGNVNKAVVITPSTTNISGDTLKDLVENGPKNELYLWPGEKVVFSLNSAAQIGMKGVNGAASYSVANATISGTGTVSATDMFYKINAGTGIEITNTSTDNILSITKIKAFDTADAANLLAPLTEETLTAALVGAGYEKEPEATVTATPTAVATATPTPTAAQQIKLAAPKLGKVVSAGCNALKLNWSKVKGADGYRVFVKVNGQWKALGNVKGTSYVHKNLDTGKSYTFTVRAYKNTKSGTVLSSYDKKGITGKAVLSAPSLRKAKRVSAKKATLSWKKVDGASGYVVYRKTNNGRWQIVKKITKGNVTSFTDKKLSKGKKYTYTVRAYRTVGKKNIYSGYNKKGLKIK